MSNIVSNTDVLFENKIYINHISFLCVFCVI